MRRWFPLVLILTHCAGGYVNSVSSRAAFDLDCDSSAISVTETGSPCNVIAKGCGKEALYTLVPRSPGGGCCPGGHCSVILNSEVKERESTASPKVSTGDLYGIWMNLSDGVYRVIECRAASAEHADLDGLSPVYFIYNYDEGQPPEMVQRGDYDIVDGRFINNVTWSTNPDNIGQSFSNEIFAFDGEHVVIESGSADSGRRTYKRVEDLATAPKASSETQI